MISTAKNKASEKNFEASEFLLTNKLNLICYVQIDNNKWLEYGDKSHYFQRQKHSETIWLEHEGKRIVNTYSQISLEFDANGQPVVKLAANNNNTFVFKLAQMMCYILTNGTEKDFLPGYWELEDGKSFHHIINELQTRIKGVGGICIYL